MNPLNQVFTVSEVAAIRKVTDRYIRKLCEQGKLESRRTADGVWLIHLPESSK
jgi:hypothetical protein